MATERTTLYVVLARGGSKRLPDKNLAAVGDVPLVGRAVRAGLQAARRLANRHRVIISTDSEAIAAAAGRWGGEVRFMRPAELATASATSVDALRHAVDWLAAHGETYSEVVLLQPTSPLRTAGDVVDAIETFRCGDGSSVVTVSRETEPFRPNGAVYVCTPGWLRDPGVLYVPGRTQTVPMPTERSIDVDTAADLGAAQAAWERSLLWRPGRCFIIAEAGVNHNGSLETAMRLVDAAREAGADAVKFQTFAADRVATRGAAKAAYQLATTDTDESQFDMLKRLELSRDHHLALAAGCAERGIAFLSTPFGEPDVDLLDGLDVPAVKIGSGDITHHALLARAAATLRPVMLSTGASTLEEVAGAVRALREAGCAELALLHCVSNYPADPADVNLRAMDTLARAFDCPAGYSDHTPGIEIACAAVVLGARIVEKHLTLDCAMPGPDHRASLEPREFAAMVTAIRRVESALGDGEKRPAPSEADVRATARRSLVATADLKTGTLLQPEHLAARRPGTGISPAQQGHVLGAALTRDLARGETLTWAHVRAESDT